jgi:hypothetical protein
LWLQLKTRLGGSPNGTGNYLLGGFKIETQSPWEEVADPLYKIPDFTKDQSLTAATFKTPAGVTYADLDSGLEAIPQWDEITPATQPAGTWYTDGYFLYYKLDGGETDPNDLNIHGSGNTSGQERYNGPTWTVDTGEHVRFLNPPGERNLLLRGGRSGISVIGDEGDPGIIVDGSGGLDVSYNHFVGWGGNEFGETNLTNGGNIGNEILGLDAVEYGVPKGSAMLFSTNSVGVFAGVEIRNSTDDGIQAVGESDLTVEGFLCVDCLGHGVEHNNGTASTVRIFRNGIVVQTAAAPKPGINETGDFEGHATYENIVTIQGTGNNASPIIANSTILAGRVCNNNYMTGGGANFDLWNMAKVEAGFDGYDNNEVTGISVEGFDADWFIDAGSDLVGKGIATVVGIGRDGRPFATLPSVASNEGAGL